MSDVSPAAGSGDLASAATPGEMASGLPPSGGPVPDNSMAAGQRRLRRKRIVLLSTMISVIALSGIAVMLVLGFSLGPGALAVGIGSALLPVPLLVWVFMWLDRYDPKPSWYLALSFGWGACVATLVALLVNEGASALFERMGISDVFVAVAVAPVIEESMKAAGPFALFLMRRRLSGRAFSGVVDGIVYCGLSATGFAMVENILYLGGKAYGQTVDKLGPAAAATAVIVLFIVRIVMSGFAHPLFTSMTGIGLGVAARSGRRWVRVLAPAGGLLAAIVLHSSWNLMATLAVELHQMLIMLYGYFAVMVPIFLGMVGFTLWLRAQEGRLVERTLGLYAQAGWFSPPEVAALGTTGRRLAARLWARRVAGEQGVKAMSGYQFAATQLALLRDGIRRGLDTDPARLAQTAAEEHQLLRTIANYRWYFTGRDPQTPAAVWDGRFYQLTFPDGVVRYWPAPDVPVVPIPVVLHWAPPAVFPPVAPPRWGVPPVDPRSTPGGPPTY